MTNRFTDTRYVESVTRLSLGIEPRDVLTGRATVAAVDARSERIPAPFELWRRWAPGETLTDALPVLPRHTSGRFAMLYGFDGDDLETGVQLTCRLDNGPRHGMGSHQRRFVPRRFRLEIERRSVIESAIDPAVPIERRSAAISLFPGSGAPLDPRATAIRGRILGPPTDVGERNVLRWCRLQAIEAETGTELGWAHGDDRGECVLVLGQLQGGPGLAADAMTREVNIRFVVGAQVLQPNLGDDSELRRSVDPLWDLPIEDFGPGPWPAEQPAASGRQFLPEHQTVDIAATPIPIGRTTSLEFAIN